jgi:hypothetical protein
MVCEPLGISHNLRRDSSKNTSNGIFCLNNLHDKKTCNLVSFATAYVSEQSTLVR